MLEQPPLPMQGQDIPTLIAIWDRSLTDLLQVAEDAGPQEWDCATPCPGWSVGDLVAHVTSIERFQLGLSDPPHEPDYDSLPHAQQGLSKYTEIPVDLRRGWSRADVLTEAHRTAADRLRALMAGPTMPGTEVMGVFGKPMSMERMLRMRIFDIWIHEQDIRVAIGRPGHLASPGAWVCADGMARNLAVTWARRVGAPEGSVARVVVTGPGAQFDVLLAHVPGGRGEFVADGPYPDVTVRLSWPDVVALGAGRIPADEGPRRADISGDRALGETLVTSLNSTP